LAYTGVAISAYVDTAGRLGMYSSALSISVAGTHFVYDNKPHSFLLTLNPNDLKMYLDGVLEGSDVAFTTPAAITTLYTGNLGVGYNTGPLSVSDVQIFNTSDKSKLKLVY